MNLKQKNHLAIVEYENSKRCDISILIKVGSIISSETFSDDTVILEEKKCVRVMHKGLFEEL